ncbi:MAG: ABC transporter ATP-binding protein [Pseudomonadota bacterium]
MTTQEVLRVEQLSVSYGHVQAVVDFDIAVNRGEIVALLGPNGAGKTTVLKTISGQLRAHRGKVHYGGQDIIGMRPDKICRAGVVHVPEGRQVVAPLTVEENLQLAALASRRCPPREVRAGIEHIYSLFPNLAKRRFSASGLLSGGEQQMLAIGRALIARPNVLLLDEPSMGLAPVMTEVIYEFLGNRPDVLREVGVILAEQSRIALSVANRVCILTQGRVAFSGRAVDASHDITVKAYLGTDVTASDPLSGS